MEEAAEVHRQQDPKWSLILEQIATLLAQTELKIAHKWGSDVYTYNGQNVVSYGAFKHYVAIWFYKGVFLKDPQQRLVAAQAKTKSLRQWRVTSLEELDEKIVLAYVQEAIEIEKAGLKVPVVPKPMPEIPPLLREAFAQNQALETAFFHLRPGCQREYLTYLEEAKQLATKARRLTKIEPLILAQKGLNDQYK